jgi:cytochrome c553
MNRRLEERRAYYARYKQTTKTRGKPFFPYAMFHDTAMSLLVVCVIVALAVIWKFSTPHEDPSSSGWLGKLYDEKADPGTTNFAPRPDWYFYFLFYLLRIFKWPDSVILGTVGIPTLLLLLLIALPFIDVGSERRPLRRPVAMTAAILTIISMGTLTYKGATAKESLASELSGLVPTWSQKQNFTQNQKAVAGAKLFTQAGCLTCHTYLNAGSSNLGAPNLTAEGSKNKGSQFQVNHLECPSCVNPGSPMPSFKSLGTQNLQNLAAFLEASKGGGTGGGGGTNWVYIGALIALGVVVLLLLALAAARRPPPRYA